MNERDHMTATSHKQKVTTAMAKQDLRGFACMLSRVLPVQRRQRNND